MEELKKRKTTRLEGADYNRNQAVFLTICTKERKCILSRIVGTGVLDGPQIELTKYGQIADKYIHQLNDFYDDLSVESYVIMPNHIHLLLQIHGGADGRSLIAPTISTVVRLMKSAASHEAGFALWQKGFYDHVIRSDADYLDCWQYIEGNPGKREEKHYET